MINNSEKFNKNFNKPNINFLKEISYNIKKSNFYTIDVAELTDGTWKVLECGDGQVSGLASMQNEMIFYTMLQDNL